MTSAEKPTVFEQLTAEKFIRGMLDNLDAYKTKELLSVDLQWLLQRVIVDKQEQRTMLEQLKAEIFSKVWLEDEFAAYEVVKKWDIEEIIDKKLAEGKVNG